MKRPSRPKPHAGSRPPQKRTRRGVTRDQWLGQQSRLRSMEHEDEHHHAEATKPIDERREERDRRNQATQQIEQVEDEIPHQKSRHQNRSDQCQQRRIFECHGRSMNVVSDSRNSGSFRLGFDKELIALFPEGALGGALVESLSDRLSVQAVDPCVELEVHHGQLRR